MNEKRYVVSGSEGWWWIHEPKTNSWIVTNNNEQWVKALCDFMNEHHFVLPLKDKEDKS